MAHDFTIRVKNGIWKNRIAWTTKKDKRTGEIIEVGETKEKYKDIPEDQVFFFGFANGIFYQAFNHEECMECLSGNGSCFTISYREAFECLGKAISLFEKLNFPDTDRINDIKGFFKRMKTDYKDVNEFEIRFD